ncbi:MAG: carbohydrate ABC transporter permease, partial [Chloroflexota bacterium]|nr:carbohydrate ABC transporter permease [Chloroflexota bacterium]
TLVASISIEQTRNEGRRRLRPGPLILTIVLAIGAGIMVLPFVYMISTSFKSTSEVFAVPLQWIPELLRWDNYTTALREYAIGRYFLNSLVVGVAVTALNLLTCSLAGYSFAKFTYRGRDLLFGVVLATMMIPLASMIIPLYLVVRDLGWIDSYWGLIIPAGTSAFGIFLMRQHMLAIPNDLLEAARLDGGSEPRIFLEIVLPLSRTALASLAIFIFMWNWDSFLWPLLVVTQDELRTLPLGVALFESSYGTNYPQLMAIAFLAMIPVLIVFLLLQRHFIQALTMSGIKG